MNWDEYNKQVSGQSAPTTQPKTKSSSSWADFNAAHATTTRTAPSVPGAASATVNGHANSPVFNDYRKGTNGTLAPAPSGVLSGIHFNAPGSGQPIVSVDAAGPSFHPENSSNPLVNNQFVKQGAAAANSLLGSFFGVISGADKLLQNSILKQTSTAENAAQVQGAPVSAEQATRASAGKGFGPTASEQVGDVLKTGVSALSLTPGFALTSAGMAAAREIDIPGIGKPFAAIQDFVFGNLSKGIDATTSKVFDQLNLDPETRKNVEAPIASIVNLAAQMLVFHKAGDVLDSTGKTVSGKLGADATTAAKVGNFSRGAIDAAINPYGPVFSSMKTKLTDELTKFKKSGVPITPEVADKVVSDTVKTVPIPNDSGVMPISTPGGEVHVHTDNATVLQHLLKDGENLDFKQVAYLGTDASGQPVKAKFSWNFDTQKGMLEVADTTTAVNLSHEIGHAIDARLKTDLSKIIAGNIPNYLQNKLTMDKMILDMAVGNLEGNGTAAEIRSEAMRVAAEIAAEGKRTAAVAKRVQEGKSFVDGLGDRAKVVDESTPVLKKMVDFAKGKDVFTAPKENGKVSPVEAKPSVPIAATATLPEVEAEITRRVEKFRKEAGLMAEREGAGVRLRNVTDANGNVDFVAKDFSLNRAKATMKRVADSGKKFAHTALYESDPSYRELVDRRDALRDEQIANVKTEPDAVDILFGLDKGIVELKSEIKSYEQSGIEPGQVEAVGRAAEGVGQEVSQASAPETATLAEPSKGNGKVNKVEPLPITGETKTAGLSKGVEAKAIENKLTKGFGDLPEYQTVNFKDQSKEALKLLKEDPERAKRIAMGQELPPSGLLPESVFMAVEEAATKNNDVQTLRELATSSSLGAEASAMGQRIGILRERNPDSAVSKIQDVVKVREEAAKKELGNKTLDKAKSEIAKEIKKEKPKTTKGDMNDLIDVIKC